MLAYVDAADEHHRECLELLRQHRGPLLVPTLCLAEVAHLLSSRGLEEGEIRLLGDLARGDLLLEPVEPADLMRIAELVGTYRTLPLGTADAAVVAAAERLDVSEIATLDRRHFGVVRPAHVDAFVLLP